MHTVQGGCSVSKLPNHMCMKKLPPECAETNVTVLLESSGTDLSQSGHEQLLGSFR